MADINLKQLNSTKRAANARKEVQQGASALLDKTPRKVNEQKWRRWGEPLKSHVQCEKWSKARNIWTVVTQHYLPKLKRWINGN